MGWGPGIWIFHTASLVLGQASGPLVGPQMGTEDLLICLESPLGCRSQLQLGNFLQPKLKITQHSIAILGNLSNTFYQKPARLQV